jgi:hypothetical protein
MQTRCPRLAARRRPAGSENNTDRGREVKYSSALRVSKSPPAGWRGPRRAGAPRETRNLKLSLPFDLLWLNFYSLHGILNTARRV